MLTVLREEDFDKLYDLMERSFPLDEYRPYNLQKALLENPYYTIYTRYGDEGAIEAFITIWEFAAFAFIEHFAVNPTCRNGGIGAKVLADLSELMGQKPICLEVEHPTDELKTRRIGFYERNDYHLNDYPYVMPPLAAGQNPVPLLIMTSGAPIDPETFQEIRATLYLEVYQVAANSVYQV